MPLSDEQINATAEDWLNISAAIPEAKLFRDFARAIESAATAPLLAQIAQKQKRIDGLIQEVAAGADIEASQRQRIAQLEAQLAEARKDAERLGIAVETAKDALERLSQWSNAYPISVFPEPDFAKAHELLQAGGMTLDAISASNMRHVVNGIGRSVEPAIAAIDAAIAQELQNTEAMRHTAKDER